MLDGQLEKIDRRGYVVLDAIKYGRLPPQGSLASPHWACPVLVDTFGLANGSVL
jgi:hypothetical protein